MGSGERVGKRASFSLKSDNKGRPVPNQRSRQAEGLRNTSCEVRQFDQINITVSALVLLVVPVSKSANGPGHSENGMSNVEI
jgi:hypothetical protein